MDDIYNSLSARPGSFLVRIAHRNGLAGAGGSLRRNSTVARQVMVGHS